MRSGKPGLVLAAVCAVVGLTAGPAVAQPATDPADALAARVVQLTAELTEPQAVVAHAQDLASIALDDFQAKQAALQNAQAAAGRAAAASTQAAADLDSARTALLAFVRRSYMSGSTSPAALAFLTADPANYVQREVLLHSAGVYRSNEVVRYATAAGDAEQARTAAQTALDQATQLGLQAAASLTTATQAERSARVQAATLAGQRPALQAQLDQTRQQLVALVGEPEATRRIAQAQAAADASGGDTSVPTGPVANTSAAGPADPAAVAAAIAAARGRLGTAYSWGGGGSAGPGYGLDPDAGVIGFDCSGLTQYAYAQAGVAIPRNSRAQYSSLPKVARGQLQAGDLVFWATDPGNWQTIHHVAIYLGDGTVLQAPESGDSVKISPMWWGGYLGAVRPSA